MDSLNLTLQIVSILTILIPLGIGLLRIKTAGFEFRLFIGFLAFGFIIDVTMFTMVQMQQFAHLHHVYNFYSLIECMFFYWFLNRNASSGALVNVVKILILVTVIFWLLFVVTFPTMLFRMGIASRIFDTVYEICVAVYAGFLLLQFVEKKPNVIEQPVFWMVLGIFFYCFCTFFIMGLLHTIVSHEIWFLNNIFNILTYLLYAIGFSRLDRRSPLRRVRKD